MTLRENVDTGHIFNYDYMFTDSNFPLTDHIYQPTTFLNMNPGLRKLLFSQGNKKYRLEMLYRPVLFNYSKLISSG